MRILLQARTAHFSMLNQPQMPKLIEVSPFARDKTSELIKKYFIYKAMGSDFFINYSLSAV